jgi:hypothetical protein
MAAGAHPNSTSNLKINENTFYKAIGGAAMHTEALSITQ